jgi:hypothetical protein
MVTYKTNPDDSKWLVDQCDEYRILPAHYETIEEALDRVAFLRTKKITARVAALVAEPTDTAKDFKASRYDQDTQEG